MEITRQHIHFWDAQKLAEAHAALEKSPARRKLKALYLDSPKIRRMVWHSGPDLPEGPSIHKLIPTDERPDSVFHGRAFGRKKNREINGKDHHLMSNLSNFVAGKIRRGETFEAALLHFCDRVRMGGGHQPYEKFAQRWARKLNIETGVDHAAEFAEYGRRGIDGKRRA